MENENIQAKSVAEHTAEQTRSGGCYRPNVDILEKESELLVLADIPGANRDTIDIRFEDGSLEIHAPVEEPNAENRRCLMQEYGIGNYYRSFQISEVIDASRITAEYGDGVLTLHLPKAEAAKPHKITVGCAC